MIHMICPKHNHNVTKNSEWRVPSLISTKIGTRHTCAPSWSIISSNLRFDVQITKEIQGKWRCYWIHPPIFSYGGHVSNVKDDCRVGTDKGKLFDNQGKWDGTPRQRNALQILILIKTFASSTQWKNDSKEIIFELRRWPQEQHLCPPYNLKPHEQLLRPP